MPLFARYDVFISYKSEDRAIAERIQAQLERHKLNVWRDERLADAAGQAYDLTINDALDESAKVLVLWSRLAIQSDWVRGEANKGREQKKLVPLLIEPCRDLLPAPFNITQDLALDLAAIEADPTPLLRALGATADGIPGSPGAVITERSRHGTLPASRSLAPGEARPKRPRAGGADPGAAVLAHSGWPGTAPIRRRPGRVQGQGDGVQLRRELRRDQGRGRAHQMKRPG